MVESQLKQRQSFYGDCTLNHSAKLTFTGVQNYIKKERKEGRKEKRKKGRKGKQKMRKVS